ncbi:myosin-6-like [Kryptolebias marmoratus]|uniref:myosin-6-like n=1 Tax=Kryptolebias marmoratus TaxID=37003 RepID=UPI0018ACFDC8|nr:myosin-6-like [Kryptolebias marmoratus]
MYSQENTFQTVPMAATGSGPRNMDHRENFRQERRPQRYSRPGGYYNQETYPNYNQYHHGPPNYQNIIPPSGYPVFHQPLPMMNPFMLFQENMELKAKLCEAMSEIQKLTTQRQEQTPQKYETIIYELKKELNQVRNEKEACEQTILHLKNLEESNLELKAELEKTQNWLSESRVREFNADFNSIAARKLINSLNRDLEAAKKKMVRATQDGQTGLETASQLEKLQSQLNEATSTIDYLKQELHKVYKEKEDCVKDVFELKDIVQSKLQMESKLEQAQSELRNLGNKLFDKTVKLDQSKNMIDRLNRELEAANRNLQSKNNIQPTQDQDTETQADLEELPAEDKEITEAHQDEQLEPKPELTALNEQLPKAEEPFTEPMEHLQNELPGPLEIKSDQETIDKNDELQNIMDEKILHLEAKMKLLDTKKPKRKKRNWFVRLFTCTTHMPSEE